LSADPDEVLMAHVQRRDAAAFEVLLERHLVPLGRFLQRLTGNAADADDLAQETFLRVWREATRWQPGRVRFTTWLYRIGRNLAIDRHRRRRDLTGIDVDEPESGSNPGADYEHAERDRRVRAAVAALPERQRTALLLCHFQGMSNQDAALVLDVSVDALESLLARARRALKQELRIYIEDSRS
jgi:RNA polymerase sigma-70 factor (ECF subfamily)